MPKALNRFKDLIYITHAYFASTNARNNFDLRLNVVTGKLGCEIDLKVENYYLGLIADSTKAPPVKDP